MKPTPPQKHLTDKDVKIETLERCLDILADAISKAGSEGELYFPIWERIEREIAERKRKQEIYTAAHERIRSLS